MDRLTVAITIWHWFLNDTQSRAIHLAFAVFLAFLAFPAFSNSPTRYIPWFDYSLAILAAACASYLFLFNDQLAMRPGLPTTMDLVVSAIGLALTLEAARRSLGPALMLIALFFLLYVFLVTALCYQKYYVGRGPLSKKP